MRGLQKLNAPSTGLRQLYGWIHHNGNERAFSLLEVLISLFLSTVVISTSLKIWVTLQQAEVTSLKADEVHYMWLNMERVLAEDVHSATSARILFGNLDLTTDNGITFQYRVNPAGELVRIASGGGTAVLATGVKSIGVNMVGKTIQVTATFNDGAVNNMVFAMLSAM